MNIQSKSKIYDPKNAKLTAHILWRYSPNGSISQSKLANIFAW